MLTQVPQVLQAVAKYPARHCMHAGAPILPRPVQGLMRPTTDVLLHWYSWGHRMHASAEEAREVFEKRRRGQAVALLLPWGQ